MSDAGYFDDFLWEIGCQLFCCRTLVYIVVTLRCKCLLGPFAYVKQHQTRKASVAATKTLRLVDESVRRLRLRRHVQPDGQLFLAREVVILELSK